MQLRRWGSAADPEEGTGWGSCPDKLPCLSLAAKIHQIDQRKQVARLEGHWILRGIGPSPNKSESDFVSPVLYKSRFLLLTF